MGPTGREEDRHERCLRGSISLAWWLCGCRGLGMGNRLLARVEGRRPGAKEFSTSVPQVKSLRPSHLLGHTSDCTSWSLWSLLGQQKHPKLIHFRMNHHPWVSMKIFLQNSHFYFLLSFHCSPSFWLSRFLAVSRTCTTSISPPVPSTLFVQFLPRRQGPAPPRRL